MVTKCSRRGANPKPFQIMVFKENEWCKPMIYLA